MGFYCSTAASCTGCTAASTDASAVTVASAPASVAVCDLHELQTVAVSASVTARTIERMLNMIDFSLVPLLAFIMLS